MPSHKRPQTKADKINRAMKNVRAMDTVVESPLDRALTDKSLTKKYPEAARLLKEVIENLILLNRLKCSQYILSALVCFECYG